MPVSVLDSQDDTVGLHNRYLLVFTGAKVGVGGGL